MCQKWSNEWQTIDPDHNLYSGMIWSEASLFAQACKNTKDKYGSLE